MADGVITRREIIEDEAIKWGAEYVKQIEPAIAKNKEFVDSILALAAANEKVRGSGNQKELVTAQNAVAESAKKTIAVWKEQDQLETALISTKKKNQLATEGTNRALVAERVALAETNKKVKEEIRDRLGLTDAYSKLDAKRRAAQRTLMNLIASEKASTKEIKLAQREYDVLAVKVAKADKAAD